MSEKGNDVNWTQERGGLYRLYVDEVMVAQVERGAETRSWYFTAVRHGEEACGRTGTLADAQAAAEKLLAEA